MDCYSLPTSVLINEQKFKIRNSADYRMILDCFEALEDTELDSNMRVYTAMIIFYEAISELEDIPKVFGSNIKNAVLEMYKFFNCGKESVGAKCPYKLIDWQEDSQMIASAINNVTKKEVRQEYYIHWWTFMGYYCAIGESTLSTVVGIRWKIANHKKLEKHERDFKNQNPEYFNWDAKNVIQKENDELLKSLWNQ